MEGGTLIKADGAPLWRGRALRRLCSVLLGALLASMIAGALPPAIRSVAAPGALVAFTDYTRGGNLTMIDARGARVTLTTRASTTERSRISYPWYAWSPDRAYLLVVRRRPAATSGGDPWAWDLLLLDRRGGLLRTLATELPEAFYPNWAVDTDQIAYEAGGTQKTPGTQCCWITLHHQVRVVDPSGQLIGGWHYTTQIYGDGGPADDWLGHAGAQWLYLREQGWVGDYQMLIPRLPLSWSASRHLAIYDVGGRGLHFLSVDTTTGKARAISKWDDWASVALAPSGDELAVGTAADRKIVLVDPRSGAALRTVAAGELPVWSPDGRWLYYEQRTVVRHLTFAGEGLGWQLMDGETYTATPHGAEDAYRSSLWRVAPVPGAIPVRLTEQDAYGLGPVQTAGDVRTLFFSRVDNSWEFWRHPEADGATRVRRYGPRVRLLQLVPDGRVLVLADDAGLPAA